MILVALSSCLAERVFAELEPSVIEPLPPPAGLTLSAEGCGGCHPAILAEWRASRMAQAWTDPLFQAQHTEEGNALCVRCHAPLHEQAPTLVTGLSSLLPLAFEEEPNPDFSAALREEGVTCLACHLREGGVIAGLRGEPAPHPTVLDPELGEVACARCHQLAEPPLSRAKRPLADTHGEHAAWRELTGRDEGCAGCHMPEVERPVALGGPSRRTRAHTFDPRIGEGIALSLEDGAAILENRAGHGVPTAEPMRAYLVRGLAGERSEERRIERRMDGYRDLEDTTLAPGEVRRIAFSFPAERVELVYVACTDPALQHAAPEPRVVASVP